MTASLIPSVDLTPILGGAFAIGIGFGSQTIISNFISGLILLVERPIKVSDMIEVDGTLGRVESIGLRSTRVRTFDNIHIVLPNSSFLEKNVINWNLRDDVVRGHVAVGVAYGSDVDRVHEVLMEAAQSVDFVVHDPAPRIRFVEMGDSALIFRVQSWVDEPANRGICIDGLNTAIYKALGRANIQIPFPQRVVHGVPPAT